MLSEMGWRITPTPLRLPLLKRSERRVPPWVLSSMILRRLQLLLENLQHRFEYVKEVRSAPRGTIHWSEYAMRSAPTAQFLALPCSYPDLRDDRSLKGVIRFALERQLGSLQTQSAHGSHIHKLIDFCSVLLGKVQSVASITPTVRKIQAWQQRPLRNEVLREGIQAIEWTAESRGLAGLGDMEGIPWTMPMDAFFEAFVETVLRSLSRRIGAQLQVGRQRQTVHPMIWKPAFAGSQKSLVPDFLLARGDTTFVIDAKYKRHFEELDSHSWRTVESELRERHRADLFQVLAYANLARTSRVVTCLVYPCEVALWEDLKRRGRLFHKANVTAGSRPLSLWLTAIPMGKTVDEIVASLEVEFRTEAAEVLA
jgi:5-methylcytosine-specific restriction endonuclease McrBC regulatory subunit McrC